MKTAKQIHKRLDTPPVEEQTAFLLELIDRKPIKDVSLVELFENTIDFRESCYDAILDFADRFRKAHPTIYDNEYEFVELKLTEHAIPVPCSPFRVHHLPFPKTVNIIFSWKFSLSL